MPGGKAGSGAEREVEALDPFGNPAPNPLGAGPRLSPSSASLDEPYLQVIVFGAVLLRSTPKAPI